MSSFRPPVALAVHSPGHMAQTPWRVALYLDDQGSEEQQGALGSIFSGAAGGHPAVLAEVADVKITAMAGQGGAQVTIANHPLAIAPGQELVAARAEHLRFTDHGYEWELSDSNGFFSPFAYNG